MGALEIFIILHLLGDYILQNRWMALNKSKSWVICNLHSLIYAVPFGFVFSGKIFIYVWLTHLLLDKFSIAELWLRLIKGRSLRSIGETVVGLCESPDNKNVYIGFTTIVYCVVDFFWHMVITLPVIM